MLSRLRLRLHVAIYSNKYLGTILQKKQITLKYMGLHLCVPHRCDFFSTCFCREWTTCPPKILVTCINIGSRTARIRQSCVHILHGRMEFSQNNGLISLIFPPTPNPRKKKRRRLLRNRPQKVAGKNPNVWPQPKDSLSVKIRKLKKKNKKILKTILLWISRSIGRGPKENSDLEQKLAN